MAGFYRIMTVVLFSAAGLFILALIASFDPIGAIYDRAKKNRHARRIQSAQETVRRCADEVLTDAVRHDITLDYLQQNHMIVQANPAWKEGA